MTIRINKEILWHIKGEKHIWIKLEQRKARVPVAAILSKFTISLHEQ